ncbi:MAG: 3-oxoacyl-ACP reductase [Candidatus Rokubacteria bacterium 13_1_20CM_4_68_9]|nr:MAG: 3-oxoacyl-ACP reductase [Candidatus Rokubacteria bacterium 13_1_20CM_4_68_9]
MDLGLRGKVALVTAASKGMGKACSLGLAAEGARVAMCARTEGDIKNAAEEVRAKTGAEVLAMTADVTKAEDVKSIVARTKQTFGRIDVLVANCGGPPRGELHQVTDEQWYRAFEVSLLSVVRLVREVAPLMREHKWGRILTIQSVSVKQPVDGLLLSNAVRPGVAGLSKTLAPELGKDNITINVVCPGRIMTDRFLGGAKQAGMPVDEYVARSAQDVPLGRIGTPEEFANVCVFLASEKASYVTGVVIQVDGGMVRGIL